MPIKKLAKKSPARSSPSARTDISSCSSCACCHCCVFVFFPSLPLSFRCYVVSCWSWEKSCRKCRTHFLRGVLWTNSLIQHRSLPANRLSSKPTYLLCSECVRVSFIFCFSRSIYPTLKKSLMLETRGKAVLQKCSTGVCMCIMSPAEAEAEEEKKACRFPRLNPSEGGRRK